MHIVYIHVQGGPIKTAYHIFAATIDIITRFCWSVQKLQQKRTSDNFLKRVLNILCKVTRNGLRHTRLLTCVLDDDQPGLGWHWHRPVLKTTYPGHLSSRWTYWAMSIAWIRVNKAYTDCDKTLWHTSKLILLQSVSTDIYKVSYFD